MIQLPQSNERPVQAPSSQIIFHVVLSPAAPLIQLKVISVPVSKPSSASVSGSPFLIPNKKLIFSNFANETNILIFTCRELYLHLSLANHMVCPDQSYVDDSYRYFLVPSSLLILHSNFRIYH